jgi:hypothetical protein
MRMIAGHERYFESGVKPAPENLSDICGSDNDSAIQKCLNAIDKEPFNYWL